MDLLVITWNFPPRQGGIENLMAGLCRQLKKNHKVYVITAYAASDADADLEDWIFRARWPGFLSFAVYAVWKGFLLLWRNPGVSVVLGGSAAVIPVVLLLAGVCRRKAFVLVHGLDLVYPSFPYQISCVRWIGHCDGVIANSRYTADLAKGKKVREGALHIIPPGVNWQTFVPVGWDGGKRDMGLEGRKLLLYVGRLTARKGVKEFIENCLPRVAAEVPEVCLIVVGGNPTDSMVHRGDVLGEIEALVQEMKLAHHVRLLGWLGDSDLVKIYWLSDLVVLPAIPLRDDVEGFGIVLLEAAAAAVPSVAFRVGGIPDAIEHGRSGVLVESGDYGHMSQTIIGLLRDDQTRSSMGRYAQKRVRDQFGWETIAQRYAALFESYERGSGES